MLRYTEVRINGSDEMKKDHQFKRRRKSVTLRWTMISLQYRLIIERGRELSYAAELSNAQDNNNICGDNHISKSGGFNKLSGSARPVNMHCYRSMA